LNDPRFKIVPDYREAKILWLTTEYNSRSFENWEINFEQTYVNFYNKEGAIVVKSHLANLINATLVDKSCIQTSFDLESALP
jgi:hypothetical protein